MILYWIGSLVLLLAVFPVVVYLLNGVLTEARAIVPTVQHIAHLARAGRGSAPSRGPRRRRARAAR
jgi:hypothetical protein